MKEFGEYVMPKASKEDQKIKLQYYGKFCFVLFLRAENQMEKQQNFLFDKIKSFSFSNIKTLQYSIKY